MEQKAQQQQIKQIRNEENKEENKKKSLIQTPNEWVNSNRPDLYFIKVKAKRRNENKNVGKKAQSNNTNHRKKQPSKNGYDFVTKAIYIFAA